MRFRVVQKHGSRPLAIINVILRILEIMFALVVLVDWCLLAKGINWHQLAKLESSRVRGKILLQVIEGFLYAMPPLSILTAIVFLLIPMLAGYRYVALSAPWELIVVLGWSGAFAVAKLGIMQEGLSRQGEIDKFYRWFCAPFVELHLKCLITPQQTGQAWDLVWLTCANLTLWMLSLLLGFCASIYICVIEQDTVCTI